MLNAGKLVKQIAGTFGFLKKHTFTTRRVAWKMRIGMRSLNSGA
jgi:hypothetical protein